MDSNLAIKLKKSTFLEKRFHQLMSQLIVLGYSEEDCVKILFSKAGMKGVETLISLHTTLTQEPYALTHQQLKKITTNLGGANNLEAVRDSFLLYLWS